MINLYKNNKNKPNRYKIRSQCRNYELKDSDFNK